jgi:hypothetical protein
MVDDDRAPEKGQSKFEKADRKNTSLLAEMIGFLGQNKKWWLLPIMAVFLVIGLLVLIQTTAAAPFIYTFF